MWAQAAISLATNSTSVGRQTKRESAMVSYMYNILDATLAGYINDTSTFFEHDTLVSILLCESIKAIFSKMLFLQWMVWEISTETRPMSTHTAYSNGSTLLFKSPPNTTVL